MTTHSPATHSPSPSHYYSQPRPSFSHSETIDLTLDDEPPDHPRQIKRFRSDLSASETSPSNSPTPSLTTPSPSLSHIQIPPSEQSSFTSSFTQPLMRDSVQASSSFQPKFTGPSNSAAFFGNRNNTLLLHNPLSRHSSATDVSLTNPNQRLQQQQHRQIIDLTNSPSPPPQAPVNHYQSQSHPQSSADIPPKTPVCIGQLTVTALVLYPVNYLQPSYSSTPNPESEWGPVKLHYDAMAKAKNPASQETIHILTPPMIKQGAAPGQVSPGENFGVVEQKVASVLGPMLGKGLIRIDAKVRRGVPNLPILPLQMLVHTPNGNIPIVARYFQQHGLLLDHPSPIWDYSRISKLLYKNPHNPPPGGHARNLLGPNRNSFSGPGGSRFGPTTVNSKSVEVQRSQVDEVFKSLKSGDELEETDPTPDIATKLYPHQKKALTFLLDREGEIQGAGGKSSLWQARILPHAQTKSWVNLVTQREIHTEPVECKGALLADDMGLGKTITCVSLIAATLQSARSFSTLPLPPLPKPPQEEGMSSSLSASHFSGAVWGMPDGSNEHSSAKKKAKAVKEQEKWETEYSRARRIKIRSRATLIICPLSTVMNWEEQFREHWAGEVQVVGGAAGSNCGPASTACSSASTPCPSNPCSTSTYPTPIAEDVKTEFFESSSGPEPSEKIPTPTPPPQKKGNPLRVYVYHGNARRPDPAFLADFDAVITTYATLASEYSRQSRSITAAAADEEEESVSSENYDDVVEHDASGNPILELKERKNLKRKKQAHLFSGFVEASSPLQSIYWFRVVLDEAHAIKETTTVGSRASCDLEADRRLCLTGTPVQNKLDDVYALIKFLRLNPFDDRNIWQEFVGVPVKFGQPLGVARLQTIMKCITLRRTKETKTKTGEAILSLPPRKDELRLLRFEEQEQNIYDRFFSESKAEYKELSTKNEVMKNYVGILQKILRLRQICDHFELVDGKGPSAEFGLNFEEIAEAITKEGLNASRANAIFSLIRESGTAQCVECGSELGAPTDSQQDNAIESSSCSAPKRGRKPKAGSSRVPTRQSSPAVARPILSRCQHLFCMGCFHANTFPNWPNVAQDVLRPCSICQTALAPTDAIEVNPDINVLDASGKKKAIKKEKRQKGISLDQFHPSTKVKSLLNDLLVFSRANPYSANYDPSSLEIQMVDVDGNQLDDSIVKTVVFSQWTSMLDKVEDALELAGIRYDRLDGTMRREERTRAMDALKNDPSCEVLLVSLKAGGVGLNLTAAQRVYLMDPYWNPAVENQAVDRIHRLGQTRPVTTVKLIIENTIEARLLEVQRKKTELANMTLGQHLSKAEIIQRRMEDLDQLFSNS